MELKDGQVIGFSVNLVENGITIHKDTYTKPKSQADRMYPGTDWEKDRVQNTVVASSLDEARSVIEEIVGQMSIPSPDAG